jgi:hypothetical protein
MAVYANAAGNVPGAKLAETPELTLVAGRNEIAPATGAQLAAGPIWIMAVFNMSTDVSHDATTGTTWHYLPLNYLNPLPAMLNGASNTTTPDTSLSNMNYYLRVY